MINREIEDLIDAGYVTDTVMRYRTMQAVEGILHQLGRIADHLEGAVAA